MGADRASRVDTRSVRRRAVDYAGLADMKADLDRIAAAYASGTLRRLGNWDAGPVLDHLAMAVRRSIEGFPIKAPLHLRLIGPLVKKRVLSRPFEPGIKLDASAEGQAWRAGVSFEDALSDLRAQLARVDTAAGGRERMTMPHPFFGVMTHEEWGIYHLRHGALHLSFLGA